MKFNKEQIEGLARVSDGLVIAAILGAIVGAAGHSTLTNFELCLLAVATPILLLFSFILRGKIK